VEDNSQSFPLFSFYLTSPARGLRKMAKNLIPGHGAPSNDSNPGFHVCSLDYVSYDKGQRRRI